MHWGRTVTSDCSPAAPPRFAVPGRERRITLAVIGVTALSALAMVIYPAVTGWLGLDAVRSGIFIDATIHDVAQVVGAGYSLSPATGDAVTITKLMRLAWLMPVLVCVALVVHRARRRLAVRRWSLGSR